MRDSENVIHAPAGELALNVSTQPSDDHRSDAIQDIANTSAIHLERARRLGRQLHIQVAIDASGWLRGEVELVFTKSRDGTIRPVKVRVGREASDDDVLAGGGVVACCAQYNSAIGALRQLGERLTAMVRQERITLMPGSPVAYAHRELSRLDQLIARRQAICMGYGVIGLAPLIREIELFERCVADLAPIVLTAERAAHTAEPRAASLPRLAHRWLRWALGLKGARHEESSRRSRV